jgi:glycosyltransferase involved in cell wall biosynthesis
MPLRILHLDAGRDWRGGQRQVLLLAEGQRAAGREPLLVAPRDAPLLTRAKAAGVATATVRIRAELDLLAARRLRRLVRAWGPAVVHAHDARAHAIALLALVGLPVPLVVTRRVPFPPRGRVKYGRRVARFIAISHAVREGLEAGGIDPDRIDVVYSGVATPPVAAPRDWRRECGWPDDTVLCGLVGAMTREKGIAELEAIARALPTTARAHARIVLLGGSHAGATTVGGIPAFRAGFVDRVHEAMAGLDVLWHPSRAEGLGTAVIDAMALGVPPVVFGVGGLVELVHDGIEGRVVPPADTAAFAAAAGALIDDAAARRRLAAAGPARAAQFSVAAMVAGVDATYARIRRTSDPVAG